MHEFRCVIYRVTPAGRAMAAIAWRGDDWAIRPADDAQPLELHGLLSRLLDGPFSTSIEELRSLGYVGTPILVTAPSPTEAARLAFEERKGES